MVNNRFLKGKTQKQLESFEVFAGILVILIVGLFNITRNTSLRIVGDEFGYWTAGATFAGLDWTSVASYNGYYSFGYGILLTPLLKLPVPQTVKYQLAIVLNILMLVAVFCLFVRLMKKAGADSLNAVLIALTGTLYSSNLAYSQYTLAETFILVLYVLIVYFNITNYLDGSIHTAIILPLLLVLLYAAHQRTIGVVVPALLFFCIVSISRKRYRDLLAFFVLFFLLFAAFFLCKSYYQSIIHNFNDANLASGQVSKIKALFTLSGFFAFLKGLFGKTAYSLLASFSIVAISTIRILKNFIRDLKTKNLRQTTVIGCYLLANLFLMEVISALYLLEYTRRFDLITYGRYHDFTISALIVFEFFMCFVKNEKADRKQFIIAAVSMIIITIGAIFFIPNDLPISHVNIFSPGIALFMIQGNHLWLALLLGIIGLFLYNWYNSAQITFPANHEVHLNVIPLGFLGIFLVMAAAALLWTYSWSIEGCTNEEHLAKQIDADDSIQGLWYYASDSPIDVDFMQFLLNEKSILCFDDIQILSELNDDELVLTTRTSQLINREWLRQYKLMGESSYLSLWKRAQIRQNVYDRFDLNEELERANSDTPILSGLNLPEDNGTIWTNGTITLFLNNPYENVFVLQGYIPEYPDPAVKKQSIQIEINDIPVTTISVNCGESFTAEIDCNDYSDLLENHIYNDRITLKLIPSFVFKPSDYGQPDQRILSYIISKMTWKEGN